MIGNRADAVVRGFNFNFVKEVEVELAEAA